MLGIGCRFPGGVTTPEELWALLSAGADAITDVPRDRFDADAVFDADPDAPGALYVRRGGFVEGIERFDAEFFGIAPREARRMDPQQRLLLEVAWEALEDGGLPPDRLAGSATGVFVGISSHDYSDVQGGPRHRRLIDAYTNAGGALSIAANRISYHLDLRGPSLAVDTACSSGLTAVHLACRSLASGESDVAIAGGVNVILAPEPIIGFCKAGMLSPDGRSMAFDARANGYARGEGAGALALKPLRRALADGDPIRAVIRGTAVNQDGWTSGISVPNPEAQTALIEAALASGGMGPADVQYVEAHGTGTPVGDPIEAGAIGAALGSGRRSGGPCLIGSIKGNLGHLEAAAGIAGLVKAVLALERREIPASLHVERPNPAIPFEALGLRVATEREPWPPAAGPPAAGVNSFGFGGANAHVVVEAAPPARARAEASDRDGPHLVALSARSPEALEQTAARWADLLASPGAPALHDLAHTAALRRAHHRHRLVAVAGSCNELAAALAAHAAGRSEAGLRAGSAPADGARVAFVFSGMGAQWWGMGRGLMRDEPAFAETIRECDRLLAPLAGWSLLDELATDEPRSRVTEARVAHVANLAVQLGLAALWESWGVVPDAVVGHSSGEAAAACVAGALPIEEALRLTFHRGRLQQLTAGRGGMLATGLSEADALRLAEASDGRVCVAAVNGPASVTLSGEDAALAELARALEAEGTFCRTVPVDVPYHGPQMDALRDELLEALEGIESRPPRVPMLSTVTGEPLDGQPLDAGYWWRNVRRPVRFADAVARAAEDGCTLFVELAPHPVLGGAVRECLAAAGRDAAVLPSLRRGADDRRVMLGSLGELHVRGHPVRWEGVVGPGGRHVRLPGYPWQRERHWLDLPEDAEAAAGSPSGHPLLGRRLRGPRPTWEAELADPRLGYLDDHAVEGAVTFPAAAYVELGLAAGRALHPTGPLALEHVELLRLLPISSRDDWLVQCAHDPGASRLEVHAARRGGEPSWTRHAGAWLRPAAPGTAEEPPEDIAALRSRCPLPVPVADLYRRAEEEHGLRYGPAFRGVTALWAGDGEAVGRIEAPACLGAVDGHEVHPALLDAAFQVIVGAAGTLDGDEAPDGPIVPVSIAKVALSGSPGAAFWAHATVGRAPDGGWSAGVRLLDDGGAPMLACRDVRLRALGRGRPAQADSWLYAERWEPAPPPAARARGGLPDPERLADAARGALDGEAGRFMATYYREVEPALNALAGRYARAAGALDAAEVAPRHRRMRDRLVSAAGLSGAEGPPDELVGRLLERHPGYRPFTELVRHSGERLARTLAGEEDATGWLFSGEPWEALVASYSSPPPFRMVNGAVADVIAAALRGRPPRSRLRVLEVGAGTGGTTGYALARLAGAPADYVVTDVSPLLVRRARELLPPREGLAFEVLDIEAEVEAGLGSFDVVVAANVVHATADVVATLRRLRGLLAPGGVAVIQEAIRRSAWADLVFGQLEGWWRAEDRDLRPDHPLLGEDGWRAALAEAGYASSASLADAAVDGGDPAQAVLVASAPAAPAAGAANGRPAGRRWLLLADAGGVAEALAGGLRRRGDRCTLVGLGAAGWPALLAGLRSGPHEPGGIVHLRALDEPAEPPAPEDLLVAAQAGCDDVAALSAALRALEGPPPEVWLVTAGAQATGASDGDLRLSQSPLWGIGRILRNERLGLRCRLVDLGAGCPDDDVAALLEALLARGDPDGGWEPELAFRGGRPLARRLGRAPLEREEAPATRRLAPDEAAFRLEVDAPGDLSSLRLRRAPPADRPGPGEVEVRVEAAPLGFKDVLLALGVLSTADGGPPTLGTECAGVVTACGPGVDAAAPGDWVLAIADHAFGSRVVAPQELVAPLPRGLSPEEAATAPGTFGTAIRALEHLARVRPEERVLIHSGAGGVGLAAVQVARRAGAEVLATAGTPEKRAFLASLGVAHVMDSRSPTWADEVLRVTGGEGVDVVLNSLVGDALTRGVEVLRPYGRFVEIGMRDQIRNAPLGMAPFARDLAFFSLHLDHLTDDRPDEMGALLREVARDLDEGRLEPLPHTVFDLSEAEHGFRAMAQARHIGRIVLAVGEPAYEVAERRGGGPYRPDATYLIVGGLGGLGLSLAAHMARSGARHLVLAGRRGHPGPEEEPALRALRSSAAAEIVTAPCDAADPADLSRLLAEIHATMPPLRGVVHAAAVLDDGLLEEVGPGRVRAVLAPKVAGGWNLHRETLDDDLDLFVVLSSFSSILGPPGQGGYAAANAFLDALVAHRRGLGLPALGLNLGALDDAGMVARSAEVREYLDLLGMMGMPTRAVWGLLDELLAAGVDRRMVARIDWGSWSDGPAAALRASVFAPLSDLAEGPAPGAASAGAEALRARLAAASPGERAGVVEEHVARIVATVLDAAPERLDRERPLSRLGLDSLMAVELMTALQQDLGVAAPLADLLRWTSLRDLAELAAGQMAEAAGETGAVGSDARRR